MADIDSKTLEQVIMGALDGYSNTSAGGQQQSAVNKAVIKWLKNNPNFQSAIDKASKNSQKDSKVLKDATDKITLAVKDEAKVTRKELEKIGQDSDNNWSKFTNFMENKYVKMVLKGITAAGVAISQGVRNGLQVVNKQQSIYNNTGMSVGYDNLLDSIHNTYISMDDLSNLITKNSDAFRGLTKNLGSASKTTIDLAQTHKKYIENMSKNGFYRSTQEATEDLADFLEHERKFGTIQNIKNQQDLQDKAQKFNKTLLMAQEAFGINKKKISDGSLIDAIKFKAMRSGQDTTRLDALFTKLAEAGMSAADQEAIISGKFDTTNSRFMMQSNPDLVRQIQELGQNPNNLNSMSEEGWVKYSNDLQAGLSESINKNLDQFKVQQIAAVDYLKSGASLAISQQQVANKATNPQSDKERKDNMSSIKAVVDLENEANRAKNELFRTVTPSMKTFNTELNALTEVTKKAADAMGWLADKKKGLDGWGDILSMGAQAAVAYGGMKLGGAALKGLGKFGGKTLEKIGLKTATKTGAKAATKAAVKAGTKAAVKTGAKAATKGAGKSLLKKIPGVGLLAGLGFGAMRAFNGDWKGALGEVASGAASTIPGVGTAASMAIDAGLVIRDAKNAVEAEKQKLEESNTSTEETNTSKKPSENMEVIDYSNILNSINNNIVTLNNTLKNLPKNSVTY